MAQKPSIPKGTRDFSPVEMSKRNYIFDTIKSVFTLHGFHQIETPAMENLSTLMGKYGDEGDKLLFKILNSGDFLSNVNDEQLAERNSTKLMRSIAEKGLRYDLTVPFARFVVQHQNEIKFPFKRFQIQPVWRADRPQRGRYREFYQCDADVIGTDSLLNEVDLLQIIDEVFCRFGINIAIKLNNRKVLSGIAETIGQPDKIVDITVAIDKIDKIGIDNVNAELLDKGISQKAVEQLQPVLTLSGSNEDKLNSLARSRIELLHWNNYRSQGARCRNRQHYRRRSLRQPYRRVRTRQRFRRWHLVWRRPHIRRAQPTRPISRSHPYYYKSTIRKLRRSGSNRIFEKHQ